MQLQEASWFYTDFYSDRHPSLPKLELKAFCLKFFKFSPFLRPHLSKFDELFSNFWKYLGSVPVCGGAILSECLTQVLLVRSWQSQHWGFPKGKINQGETELDCAIRETMEEVWEHFWDFSGLFFWDWMFYFPFSCKWFNPRSTFFRLVSTAQRWWTALSTSSQKSVARRFTCMSCLACL